MTQKEMIIEHLKKYGNISTFEAFVDYGVTRLSGRIFELRHDGHDIKSDRRAMRNRFGKKIMYDVYTLEE